MCLRRTSYFREHLTGILNRKALLDLPATSLVHFGKQIKPETIESFSNGWCLYREDLICNWSEELSNPPWPLWNAAGLPACHQSITWYHMTSHWKFKLGPQRNQMPKDLFLFLPQYFQFYEGRFWSRRVVDGTFSAYLELCFGWICCRKITSMWGTGVQSLISSMDTLQVY